MRYYQLVASGRQLVLFVVGVAGLIFLSFFAGLKIGLAEREDRVETAAQASRPPMPPATPTWLEPPQATPTFFPTPTPEALAPEFAEVPTPVPTATPVPTITPRPTPRPSPVERPLPRGVWVQVGALSSRMDAEGVRQRVVALGFRPDQVKVLPLASGKYRVRVGPFPDRESGSRVVARLREGGFREAFVVSE